MAKTANTASTARTDKSGKSGDAAKAASKPDTTSAAQKSQPAQKQPARTDTAVNLATLRITYVKSVIGYSQKQRDTIKSLGLRRLHQSVEHRATPEIRGMINKVSHLVRVEEVAG